VRLQGPTRGAKTVPIFVDFDNIITKKEHVLSAYCLKWKAVGTTATCSHALTQFPTLAFRFLIISSSSSSSFFFFFFFFFYFFFFLFFFFFFWDFFFFFFG